MHCVDILEINFHHQKECEINLLNFFNLKQILLFHTVISKYLGTQFICTSFWSSREKLYTDGNLEWDPSPNKSNLAKKKSN